jgi:hypothetical protein
MSRELIVEYNRSKNDIEDIPLKVEGYKDKRNTYRKNILKNYNQSTNISNGGKKTKRQNGKKGKQNKSRKSRKRIKSKK